MVFCVAVPFKTEAKLLEHLSAHGHEFGVTTAEEYLLLAERFLMGACPLDVRECLRPQGGYCRYNELSNEYGAVTADGLIATFMKPDPAVHGLPTNLDYFLRKCR